MAARVQLAPKPWRVVITGGVEKSKASRVKAAVGRRWKDRSAGRGNRSPGGLTRSGSMANRLQYSIVTRSSVGKARELRVLFLMRRMKRSIFGGCGLPSSSTKTVLLDVPIFFFRFSPEEEEEEDGREETKRGQRTSTREPRKKLRVEKERPMTVRYWKCQPYE